MQRTITRALCAVAALGLLPGLAKSATVDPTDPVGDAIAEASARLSHASTQMQNFQEDANGVARAASMLEAELELAPDRQSILARVHSTLHHASSLKAHGEELNREVASIRTVVQALSRRVASDRESDDARSVARLFGVLSQIESGMGSAERTLDSAIEDLLALVAKITGRPILEGGG